MKTFLTRFIGTISLLSFFFPTSAPAQGLSAEWAKRVGGNLNDYGFSVTADPWGNVYYTGYFGGTVDFDPGAGQSLLTAKGKQDIFISKFNANGEFIWARQIGDASNRVENMGRSVKADRFGNIYVAGLFTGSPDFNPGAGTNVLTATSSSDGFLLKMDSAGNYIWAVNIGSVLTRGTSGIITDKRTYGIALNGLDIYITGSSNDDIYISKLDTAGTFIWTKAVGGNRANYCYAIAVDDSGDCYATGMFSSDSIDFDPGPGRHVLYNSTLATSQNSYDIFIWKLDKDGNFVWAKAIGSSGLMDQGQSIAVDKTGDVYVNGSFMGVVDFNPGGTPVLLSSNFSINSYSPFVAKYSSGGSLVWAHIVGSIVPNRTSVFIPNFAYGLALDDKNNVYNIGRFTGTLDFNPGAAASDTFMLQSKGNNNIFISKLDSDGKFVWAKRFMEAGIGMGYGIHVDHSDNVYATGTFSGDINFDSLRNLAFSSVGGNDIFVAKFNQYCNTFSDSAISVSVCEDEYVFNGKTITRSGIYRDTLINQDGCDSILSLTLVLKGKLEQPAISVKEFELSTTLPYYSYQWMLDGAMIPNATSRSYTVLQNGNYRVIVSNEKGCTDTSEVYTVTNYTGIKDLGDWGAQIKIHPNPTTKEINLSSPRVIQVTLHSLEGKQILQAENPSAISLEQLPSGIYFLQIRSHGMLVRVEKIIKE